MTQQMPVLAYFHGKGPGLRAISEAGGDAMYWVQVGVLRGGDELRWGEDVLARVKSNSWRGMAADTSLGSWEMRYRDLFSRRIEMARTAGGTGERSPAGMFRRGFWGGGELVLAPGWKYRFKRRGIYRIGGD